jgi:hypothetical protein
MFPENIKINVIVTVSTKIYTTYKYYQNKFILYISIFNRIHQKIKIGRTIGDAPT